MKTINVNLYSFSELKPETQKKVLDRMRDLNVDDQEWYLNTTEYFQDQLAELGYSHPKIYFSGFWSQGDGACFDADSLDLVQWIRSTVKRQEKYKSLIDLVAEFGISGSIFKASNSNLYSHERTRTFCLETSDMTEEHDATKEQHALLDELEKDIEQDRLNLCKDIYKSLEDEYESLTTDESIKEAIEANEYTFLENGELFNN